ncbi:MAG: hypothetical protein WKF81_03855 [Thermomicrobiales bacterium]
MSRSRGQNRWIIVAMLFGIMFVLPTYAQSPESNWEQKGILETGLYESPQFSNQVTWTEAWDVDVDGSLTDGNQLVDKISLNYENKGTAVIMFIKAGGEYPEDYARRLIRYRGVAEPTAEVVWTDSDEQTSLILYETIVDGRDVSSLIEIRLVDEETTLQVVELLLYPEYAETVFESTQADIAIDSEPPFWFVDEFPTEALVD